jgi:hypothetical protein
MVEQRTITLGRVAWREYDEGLMWIPYVDGIDLDEIMGEEGPCVSATWAYTEGDPLTGFRYRFCEEPLHGKHFATAEEAINYGRETFEAWLAEKIAEDRAHLTEMTDKMTQVIDALRGKVDE